MRGVGSVKEGGQAGGEKERVVGQQRTKVFEPLSVISADSPSGSRGAWRVAVSPSASLNRERERSSMASRAPLSTSDAAPGE